jgi:hypothetical protein
MLRALSALIITSSSHTVQRSAHTFTINSIVRMSSSSSSSDAIRGGSLEIKIAAVQMCSVSDKFTNLMTCERLVKTASENGARLVCLPECCLFIGGGLYSTSSSTAVASPGETVDGPSMAAFRSMAKRFGVWLSVGSFPERMIPDEMEKGYNLQVLISPSGDIEHAYRKIHLFDSPFSGLQESKTTGMYTIYYMHAFIRIIRHLPMQHLAIVWSSPT